MINAVCLKQLIFPNGLKGASVLLTLSVKSFPNSSAACASLRASLFQLEGWFGFLCAHPSTPSGAHRLWKTAEGESFLHSSAADMLQIPVTRVGK